jgi:integrase
MSLRLVRRPNSPCWIIRGSVRGSRVEKSTEIVDDGRAASKRLAEEIRARHEIEIVEQTVHGRRVSATFGQATVIYLENGGSRRYLDRVLDHFDKTPLARIDQDAIDRGARKVYPDATPATRNRQFYTPAVAVITAAARRGLCPMPLIERPRDDKVLRVRWLKPYEAERLIEACAPHLKPLVILLLYTGARCGEALWLDWDSVDLTRRHATFPETKNGDARGVPLNGRVVAALAALPHRDGEVFRKPDGMPYERPKGDDDHSAGTRIKTAFRAAVRRAGITDFHPHDCRHTFATWHYQRHHDLTALMKIGGWKSEKMVLRYAHTNTDEHLDSVDALPGGSLGDADVTREQTA